MTTEKARLVVLAILDDLTDRRGLRQAWESIDREIRYEIEEAWLKLVLKAAAA